MLGAESLTMVKSLYIYIYIYIYTHTHTTMFIYFYKKIRVGCPRGVMVKAMDCEIVREFKLQSRHYVHFWTNTLRKGMNPLIFPAMG